MNKFSILKWKQKENIKKSKNIYSKVKQKKGNKLQFNKKNKKRKRSKKMVQFFNYVSNNFTYVGTVLSSFAIWLRTGAIDGVDILFCNGIRLQGMIWGARFRLAFKRSKSRYRYIRRWYNKNLKKIKTLFSNGESLLRTKLNQTKTKTKNVSDSTVNGPSLLRQENVKSLGEKFWMFSFRLDFQRIKWFV